MNKPRVEENVQPQWLQRQERSNLSILRLMAWISLTFGRNIGRVVLVGITLYFILSAPKERQASRAYLRRLSGRWATWADGFRHMFCFASTIHDRIYLLNHRFDLFDIQVYGEAALNAALQKQSGALLFGAHVGSFEVLRAVAQGQLGLKVAMMMATNHAHKLNATLSAINPQALQDVIALGQLGSMLQAQEKLEQGYVVGILADRSMQRLDMPRPSKASVSPQAGEYCVDFLGAKAAFSLGPWRIAALLKRQVFLMAGLYMGANRYELHFIPVADFSQTTRARRTEEMHAAVQHYADALAGLCYKAPYNWFNFYDFWEK